MKTTMLTKTAKLTILVGLSHLVLADRQGLQFCQEDNLNEVSVKPEVVAHRPSRVCL